MNTYYLFHHQNVSEQLIFSLYKVWYGKQASGLIGRGNVARVTADLCTRPAYDTTIRIDKNACRMPKKKTQQQKFWIKKAVPESHKGLFKKWCQRHGHKAVTQACIQQGMHAKDPTIVKRANFARVVRRF